MAKFQTKFKTSEMSPGFLLWKLSNLHQKIQRKALLDLDLTPSQFSVLACFLFLSEKQPMVTQAEVCRHSGIDKMLISDITKVLIKKRLIKKVANKDDGRSYVIQVTDEGVFRCNQAVRIIEQVDMKFFSGAKDMNEFLEVLIDLASQND
jgi:DNA-binding MarR family transcriptional regulator